MNLGSFYYFVLCTYINSNEKLILLFDSTGYLDLRVSIKKLI